MKRIIIFLVVLLLVFSTTSCTYNRDYYGSVESGDFIYATVLNTFGGKEGEVSIIGLTEQGKQKEVLIFPNMIDGYKVVKIGAQFAYKRSPDIEIKNAKKVYFCNMFQQTDILKTCFIYSAKNTNNVYVYIPGKNPNLGFTGYEHNMYVTGIVDNDYIVTASQTEINDINLLSANLFYLVDDEMCYFVDYIDNDIVSIIPPEPYKEGYTFDSWYKDLEFKERWDFESDIVPLYEVEYDEFGNEIRKDTKLYAKWLQE